jgi:hypothetical protein
MSSGCMVPWPMSRRRNPSIAGRLSIRQIRSDAPPAWEMCRCVQRTSKGTRTSRAEEGAQSTAALAEWAQWNTALDKECLVGQYYTVTTTTHQCERPANPVSPVGCKDLSAHNSNDFRLLALKWAWQMKGESRGDGGGRPSVKEARVGCIRRRVHASARTVSV